MTQPVKPTGHFPAPLMIFGFVSLLLGVATEVMGAFYGVTDALRGLWKSGGLVIQSEMGLPGMTGILIAAAASFGLVAAILGTPGAGKRGVIGISALLLTLTLIPTFAVWGIFWKPFGMILTVIWAWFSASIYAHTHRMPCEGVVETPAENVITLAGSLPMKRTQPRADGKN